MRPSFTGTKPATSTAPAVSALVIVLWGAGFLPKPASLTQRLRRFAFKPFRSATAAIETPGTEHCATTELLNSSV